jgi:5'-3' exonuclease
VPPKVAQGCGLRSETPFGVSTLSTTRVETQNGSLSEGALRPPTESAKLILGKDLRFEAAKPLLETSTDRRSVTSTDDRGLYVTKGAVKPTHHSGDKKTVQEHGSFLVDIEMLRGQILKEMGFSDTNRVYDYAFLCFLLGNDFLPHFPALNIRTHGTQVLMDVYHKEFNNKPQQFLVIKDKDTNLFNIEWKNVNKIIKRLSQLEYELLLKEYNVREKYDHWKWNDPKNDDDKEKMVQDIPIRYRMDEKYICPTENGWESRYYKLLFEEDTESLRRKICEEYNGGLEWVLNYYTNNDVDWHWHYEYDYGPLFKDLVYSVERPNNKVLINEDHKLPMSEYAQLSYVIPDKNNTEIKNVRWAFTRYFWEAHV